MSGDPFTGLTDSFRDRKRRDNRNGKQRWAAFGVAVGVTVLVATAAGIGGACGGWALGPDPDRGGDRVLGGVVCGLAGGVFGFLAGLWRAMRRSVVGDVLGAREEVDLGAVLYWWTIGGTALLGIVGGALGLTGAGASGPGTMGGAGAGAFLALVPAFVLRNAGQGTSRTGSGSTVTHKRT